MENNWNNLNDRFRSRSIYLHLGFHESLGLLQKDRSTRIILNFPSQLFIGSAALYGLGVKA